MGLRFPRPTPLGTCCPVCIHHALTGAVRRPVECRLLAGRRDELVASVGSINSAVGRLAQIFTAIYPSLQQLIARDPGFVAQLTGEGLLVPASSADDTPPLPGDDRWITDIASFTAPVMFRYTDMQALIQMDPIREYDETGWPARRPPQPPVPRPER